MRKKSTPTTITSAVIIGLLISGNYGPGNGQVSIFDFIAIPIVLCLLEFSLVIYHFVKSTRSMWREASLKQKRTGV